jgi:polyisoprenoid-binding protein YceI
MMVTTIHGRFTEWSGQAEVEDDDLATAVVTGTIKGASVESGLDYRDNDLRTHILDVENHPEITYRSTAVEALGAGRFRVTGDLTIAGNTHPITLDVGTEPEFTDVMGFVRIGFGATGTLHRADWNLTWNVVFEAGRMLVGDDVTIEIDGAFVRKTEPAPETQQAAGPAQS